MVLKKYPFVHQENHNDCGVACLQMVIQYYKGYVPKSVLVETTCTNKNGTTAYHMIEALKSFGFSASGMQLEISPDKKLCLPCIAHVTIDHYDHFIVIYEIDFAKNKMVIADPARQIIKISLDAFKEIYNQIFIVFYPIQKIPVYVKPHSLWRYTLYTIWKNWKSFFLILCISILVLVLSLIGTFTISILLSQTKVSWISILFFFFLIEFWKILLSFFRNLLCTKMQSRISYTLTKDTFFKIMQLPYQQYYNLPTGDFMARIGDIHWVQEAIHSVAFLLLFDGILFLLALLFFLYFNPIFLGICILLLLAYLILLFIFRPIYQKHVSVLEQANAQNQTFMLDSMHSFETIKGISITDKILNSFQKYYANYLHKLYQFQKQTQLENFIKGNLESFGYFAFLGIGVSLYKKGVIPVGMIFTYQLLFSYLMSPITQLVEYDFMFQRAKSAFNRIMNLSDKKENRLGKKEPITQIACNHLSYYREDDIPVLDSICLEWNQGQKILCMGESGSGKSSLLKCVKGYYEIEKNSILINGEQIDSYDSLYLDQAILYLSQNETLITGSIYDNVMLGEIKEDADDILKLCEVDSITKGNSLGYHMLLEENGFNLSGGQRAQIILARTLMRPFQVLMIDEGFGQMDINLERRILKRIFERFKDKLIVVVSHRKENMDLYNKVVQMKDGKIVEILERNE